MSLPRGFAAMREEVQKELASKGGKSLRDEDRAFSKDPELAKKAGSKGGRNVLREKRAFARDPKLAAEAGRKGGLATRKPKYE